MKAKDLDFLTDLVRRFCEDREWDQFHNPKDLAIGLITEASELLEHFRFANESQAKSKLFNDSDREMVSDEIADIFFFLLRFCQMNQIDIGEALISKIEKNALKYPIEKARGSNKKYTEL